MRIDQPVGQNLALPTYRTLLEQCVFNDDPIKTLSGHAAIWSVYFAEYPIAATHTEEQAMSMYEPMNTFDLLTTGVLMDRGDVSQSLSPDDILAAQAISTIFVLTSQICYGYDIWKRTVENIEEHSSQQPNIKPIYKNFILKSSSWQQLPVFAVAELLDEIFVIASDETEEQQNA
jgi:hypothetical protein